MRRRWKGAWIPNGVVSHLIRFGLPTIGLLMREKYFLHLFIFWGECKFYLLIYFYYFLLYNIVIADTRVVNEQTHLPWRGRWSGSRSWRSTSFSATLSGSWGWSQTRPDTASASCSCAVSCLTIITKTPHQTPHKPTKPHTSPPNPTQARVWAAVYYPRGRGTQTSRHTGRHQSTGFFPLWPHLTARGTSLSRDWTCVPCSGGTES